MARAGRTCVDCPAVIRQGNRCPTCQTKRAAVIRRTPAGRAADRARGTAAQRGYTSAGHQRFRKQVLDRDPICVLCKQQWSTVADHFPISRRDLVARGLDPNDASGGRGLCKSCHDQETFVRQPGGPRAKKSP